MTDRAHSELAVTVVRMLTAGALLAFGFTAVAWIGPPDPSLWLPIFGVLVGVWVVILAAAEAVAAEETGTAAVADSAVGRRSGGALTLIGRALTLGVRVLMLVFSLVRRAYVYLLIFISCAVFLVAFPAPCSSSPWPTSPPPGTPRSPSVPSLPP